MRIILKLTPTKDVYPMTQRVKVADDLFSLAVSRIRQPIEALISWSIEKTNIQKAGKVRSTKGLLLHAFCRWVNAYITLAF